MKTTVSLVMVAGCLATGCSAPRKSDSTALQGKWSGQEIRGKVEGTSFIRFAGNHFEFRGANPQEWYLGTFRLHDNTDPGRIEAVVTECPIRQYVGKTVQGIYRIEDGKLRFAATEPGSFAAPVGFDSVGARQFLMTRE